MRFEKYKFHCSFKTSAELPYYKGSTFRGVFGHALKKVVCALKQQSCDQCLLNSKCLYATVFETLPSAASSKNSRMSSSPHPFVIEPPLDAHTSYAAHDEFDFKLILFGTVNDSLPYFVYAFDRVGEIGLGRKINGSRGQFVLESINKKDHLIYSNKDKKLNIPEISVPLTSVKKVRKN